MSQFVTFLSLFLNCYNGCNIVVTAYYIDIQHFADYFTIFVLIFANIRPHNFCASQIRHNFVLSAGQSNRF